jgi:gluconate 2-dehydrogenase gamma chain
MSLRNNDSKVTESVALTYFTDFQARTVEAIAERIIPGNGGDAGATEAGVVYYIDRSITGFSAQLQRIYRLGLRELERFCQESYSAQFVEFDAERQDEVVRHWLGPEVPEPDSSSKGGSLEDLDEEQTLDNGSGESLAPVSDVLLRRLFSVVREHTVEGFFCDPIYGGNRNAVGWKLVGFPGAQWGYTAEQMKAGFDSKNIVIKTLSDLRRELHGQTNNEKYYSNEGN